MEIRNSGELISSEHKTKARTARGTIINPFDTRILTEGTVSIWSLSALLDRAISDRKSINEELANVIEGRLIVRRKKKGNYYSIKKGNAEHGITKDIDLINKLARKEYLFSRLEGTTAEIEIYDECINRFNKCFSRGAMKKYLERMIGAGYDVTEIIFSKEQNEWINEIYTPNPFHKENLIHKTESGIYLRSNGELKIANRFEERGIPYRSDDMVQITDKRTGKIKTYFADFKIPNLRGGISMLEHLGGFGFEGYGDNAIVRLNVYSECGMFNNSEIFWSFESTVNDPDQLNKLIDRMLLPY